MSADTATGAAVQDNTGSAGTTGADGATQGTGEGQTAGATQGTAGTDAGSGEGSTEGTTQSEGTLLTGDPKEGAPEAYTDFTLPDGMETNAETLESFKTVAKDADLSQDKAQELVTLGTKLVQDTLAQQQEFWANQRKEWRDSLEKDPEHEHNLTRAKRVLTKFGSPELSKFLSDSGFGDNADLFKMFVAIDKAMGEDQTPSGDNAPTPKSLAERLYGESSNTS
jgi:hypothetical protein